MALTLHRGATAAALDDAFAAWIASRLDAALAAQGTASLAVSGGRTPLGLFARLCAIGLDWRRITVTLTDERWVATDDVDSNERLVREHLLVGPAAKAHFIPLKYEAADPQSGALLANRALAALKQPFDVVLLGMGEDGHTASLFPGSPQLEAGLLDTRGVACLATENTLKPPRWRISLTASRILDSHALALQITGHQKWMVLGEALGGDDAFSLPIRFFLNQSEVPCHVFWCR